MLTDAKQILDLLVKANIAFDKERKQSDDSRKFTALIAKFLIDEDKDKIFSEILEFYNNLSSFSELNYYLRDALYAIFETPKITSASRQSAAYFEYSGYATGMTDAMAHAERHDNLLGQIDGFLRPAREQSEKEKATAELINSTNIFNRPLSYVIANLAKEEVEPRIKTGENQVRIERKR